MATLSTPAIEVRAAASSDELHFAHELMAKSHRPEFSNTMRWFESAGATYPGFRPEHTRLAYIDGELAGALRLTTDVIRLGEARLKMGGLGWVSTASDHRHKGVGTALIRETLHYMRAHGYHVSMLFGIPNFYHRFGYTTTLADYFVSIDAAEAVSASMQHVLARAIKPGDLAAVQRMHAANDADVACSLLRSTAHFSNKWSKYQDAEVITNRQGKVLAYVLAAADAQMLQVSEAGVESLAAAAALVTHCGRRAKAAGLGRVRFAVPPDHPMAHALRQLESTHETLISRERGGMMTIVDLVETLELLIPEWEERLAANALTEHNAEATLIVDDASFRIRAHRGAIDVTPGALRNKFSVNTQEFVHLVTGYAYFDDVYASERRLISSDARSLLAALFPKRNPYVHMLDRF